VPPLKKKKDRTFFKINRHIAQCQKAERGQGQEAKKKAGAQAATRSKPLRSS